MVRLCNTRFLQGLSEVRGVVSGDLHADDNQSVTTARAIKVLNDRYATRLVKSPGTRKSKEEQVKFYRKEKGN